MKNFKDIFFAFINLEQSTDRAHDLLENLRAMNYPLESLERIPAVSTPRNGMLGCSKSHILALSQFLVGDKNYALILEDDFRFTISFELFSQLLELLNSPNLNWDVFQLSARDATGYRIGSVTINNKKVDIMRILKAGSTAAYLVRREFAYILIKDFLDSACHIENNFGFIESILLSARNNRCAETLKAKHNIMTIACDHMWHKSQLSAKFIGINATIGFPGSYLSAITNKVNTNDACGQLGWGIDI